MSIACEKDVCKFVLKNIFEFDFLKVNSESVAYVLSAAQHLIDTGDEEEGGDEPFIVPVLSGWSFLPWNGKKNHSCGNKNRISGEPWTKGDFKVWLVNESQYESVGYYEVTAVANDEASLVEFKKDFQKHFSNESKIEADEPVVRYY